MTKWHFERWLIAVLLGTAGMEAPLADPLPRFVEFAAARAEEAGNRVWLDLDLIRPESKHTRIGLFEDAMVAVRERVVRRQNGYTWTGHLEDCQNCSLVVTVVDGIATATLRAEDRDYTIRRNADGDYRLASRELSLRMSEPDKPLRPPKNAQRVTPAKAQGEDRTVDILVLHTSELAGVEGANLESTIQHLADIGNSGLTNSQIDGRYRIAAIEEIDDPDLVEPTPADTALLSMTFDRAVAELRDQSGADVVSLLRSYDGFSLICGIAWLMLDTNGDPGFGYSLVEVSGDGGLFYCDETTFAHEVGHNLGADHDYGNTNGDGLFYYSHGHDVPGLFATIMSYDFPVVHYYSNPEIEYEGEPLGVDIENVNEAADNARTLDFSIPVVAGYRPSNVSSQLLTLNVTAGGRAYSDSDDVDCYGPTQCEYEFESGDTIELYAEPADRHWFSGWTGECSGEATCELVMDDDRSVGAGFVAITDFALDEVQTAYVGYYGRPGDVRGQDYWAARFDREGQGLSAIIQAFGVSAEFTERYGGLSNAELVRTVYLQLFGREPDPEGLEFYTNLLDNGIKTLQTITLDILYGAQADDRIIVDNKLEVAHYYTDQLREQDKRDLYDLAGGLAALSMVTVEPSSVTSAKAFVDGIIAAL